MVWNLTWPGGPNIGDGMQSDPSDMAQPPRGPGRPSKVAPEQALEAAMCLFWTYGFEAASIDLLSRETGMPRASLYQRYGGKEALFLAALDHYSKTRLAPVVAALGPSGSLQQDLTRFFEAVVQLATEANAARGCLVSCVLGDAAGTKPRFRAELARRFAVLEDRIAARMRTAGAGETPAGTQPEVHAMLLAAVARGLMIRARSGVSAATLSQVGRAAAAQYSIPVDVAS